MATQHQGGWWCNADVQALAIKALTASGRRGDSQGTNRKTSGRVFTIRSMRLLRLAICIPPSLFSRSAKYVFVPLQKGGKHPESLEELQ